MAPVLHRSLGPDAPFPDVRVHHVRYAPGRKLAVRYDVGLEGRQYDAVAMIAAREYLVRRSVKPEHVALARLVGRRSPAAMPLHYDVELEALVQWYPLDLELPALAEPPARLVAELEAAGVSFGEVGDPVTLGYRPRRRAVLSVGEHVLKIYSRNENFAAATANLLAAAELGSIRTAAFEGCLPARLITVQPLLSGSVPARSADVALKAGELLRELADADAPREPGLVAALPSHQLAVARASARFVAAIMPVLGGRLEALLRELEATVPSIDRLVLSHGDFSARQLLVTRDGLAVVDLDAMRVAPAALDPATYTAHLVFGEPGDLDEACEALEQLLGGYGGRPPALSWYLATSILRHSRSPFRYFDEHWPDRVEGMVAAAETALAR